ncbi:four helix bundle protein [Paramuribaculum intestinale]|nr:four helix bundle protein [Paramuribaculum intestinale]
MTKDNAKMKQSEDNLIVHKSKQFALRVIKLYHYLCEDKKEYVLSKQLLRSGTSIGANVKEAIRGQSSPNGLLFLSGAERDDNPRVRYRAALS